MNTLSQQHAIQAIFAIGKMLLCDARSSALSRVLIYQSIVEMIEWPIHRVCSPLSL